MSVSRETITEKVWDKCICSGCGQFVEVEEEEYIDWWMRGKEVLCLICDPNDWLDTPCIKDTDHQLPLIEMYFAARGLTEASLSSSTSNLNTKPFLSRLNSNWPRLAIVWIVFFLFVAWLIISRVW